VAHGPLRPVLVFQHAEKAPPGLVGEYLREAGFTLDVRRLDKGEGVPDELGRYHAVVSLDERGGEGLTGRDALAAERALLAAAVALQIPLLGIDLGARQLAAATGGGVEPLAADEIGWFPLRVVSPDPFLYGFDHRSLVFVWRRTSLVPPPEAVVVADRDAEPQVFRVGERAWGLQFHPEIEPRLARSWFASDADRARIEEATPRGFKHLRKATRRELYRSALLCGLLMANFLTVSGAREERNRQETSA